MMRIKTTAGGKLKTQWESLTVENMNAIAVRIHAAQEELLNFTFHLFAPEASRITPS